MQQLSSEGIDNLFADFYRPELNQLFYDESIVRRLNLLPHLLDLNDLEDLNTKLMNCSQIQVLVLHQKIIETLLTQFFINKDNEKKKSQILQLIEWCLNTIQLNRKNFKQIFTYIKEYMYADKLDMPLVQSLINLLQRIFEERKNLIQFPVSTFYFNCKGSGIVVDTREMRWMYQKGLTLQMWLNPYKLQSTQTSKLIYLMSDKKVGFQMLLIDNKLIYQQLDLTKQIAEPTISLIELGINEWSSLCIQIQSQRFFLKESYYIYVTCNNQQIREIKIDFPFLNFDSSVVELQFFTDFYGLASSLMLFNDGFDGNQIQCGDIRFGIQSNAHLRTLSKSLDKYCHKLILCYTPLRTKSNFILDPISKFDASLQQHSGSYIRQGVHQAISQFCRLENFVPLLLFLKKCPYNSLLNELLELFCKILKNRPESQQDAVKIELFSQMALKINEDGLQLINSDTIDILSQIKNSLLEKKLKEQFISHFLWRINIYRVDKFEIIDDYLKFLRMVYNSNTEFYIKIFGIRQILEILVYDIDPKNRLCCEEHANQMGYSKIALPTISYRQQMDAYLNIIEAILFHKFFESTLTLEYNNIVDIARVFTQKCSPCFYQLLLQRIQKLFYYEKEGHHPISEIFIQQDIMQMLLNLLTTCSCPDVKTSCIKLIAESIRLNNSKDETVIANWIAHTLGNSALVEVCEESDQDSIEERKPIVNQALQFHQLLGQIEEFNKEEQQPQKQIQQTEVKEVRRIIDYEPLYVAIMEWMVKTRVGKSNQDTFILDETYIIKSDGGLKLLMSYFQYCVDQMKGRIMQDLCMLVKWNPLSGDFLLRNEEFHWWIIENLLEMQGEYNSRELSQFEFWVWDCGLKLYSNVLKQAILCEKNGYLRIQQLQSYCKVLEKEGKEEVSQYLIRFLLKQLFQSLSDCYKLDILHQFWINLYSVIFETFRMIVSDPRTLNHSHEYVFNKFHRISNSLTIFNKELPKKWKQTFGNAEWIDQIYLSNISDILIQYCSKLSIQLIGNIEDFQLVQKAVSQLLDHKLLGEHQRMFETTLFQYNFGLKPSYFIQVSQIILQIGIEFYALNLRSSEHIKQLNTLLGTSEKLLRTFIILSENIRENSQIIEEKQDKIIYQIISSHFNFLFETKKKVLQLPYETEIIEDVVNALNQSLTNSFKFIIILEDVIANMMGRFDSFQIILFEAHKSPTVPPLNLYVTRMLKDLYKEDGSNLFELREAKTLKMNNKQITQKILQCESVFLENQSLLEMVDKLYFFNEDYYLLMRMDFEEGSRIFEQKLKTLKDHQNHQRQGYEEILFQLMVSSQTTFQYDQRIQRIDNEQIFLHRARYMFKKSFNRVRVFNQWWVHPDFMVQNNQAFDSQELEFENISQNRIYTWKMWKYETKQKCRPLLKCKLYDYPENNNNYDDSYYLNNQKNSRIMNLVDIDRKPPKKQTKESSIMDPIKSLFYSPPPQDELIFNRVQWIKTLTVRIGSIKVTQDKIYFYFESIVQKETHQSLIKFKVPEDCKLVKDWNLDQIYDLQLRRYIGRWTSLEITLLEGSTLVFNFPAGDHNKLIEKLVNLKKGVCCNLKPRILQMKLDTWSILQESKAMTKWYNYKITTFEYLMKLNKISGRSNKDLTQYPVIPWIMNDGEQLHKYRDLTKSMGNLGGPDRIEVFVQRYNMIDHFNKVPQFHYGSHYSSPAIIFHYLIRLKPFSDGARELQSGKFDLADRLFFSFTEAYKNATEELSDVRELIPEFYYMPEMFMNLSKYDYGLSQTGMRVNNVDLPNWCQQNPYIFIFGHRMEMESDYVSQFINNWIDLIFGYKQKGEEAVKALNTFYYLTYENSIDWDDLKNEKLRVSLESQAIHFGQCPSQIFDHPHPVRGKQKQQYRIVDEKAQEKVFRQKPIDGSAVNKTLIGNFQRNRSIIRIFFQSEQKLWLIRRNGEINTVKIGNSNNDNKQFEINWNKDNSINLDRFSEENAYIFDWTCFYDELPLVNKGKFILIGGVWDGRLLIYNQELEKIVESYDDQDCTITVIRQDYKMKILATGSKNGSLCIYQYGTFKTLKLITKHHNHEDAILDIFIDHDLKIILTCSQDGWIHMYNMWSGKYLRSYKHPNNQPIHKVCSYCTPLYGIAFYENKSIYSYSINGQFLAKYQLQQPMVNQGHFKVVKDTQLNDIIMLPLAMDKTIIMLVTPFLKLRSEIQLTPHLQSMNDISSYALSPDRQMIAFGTTDGEFGLCTDIRMLQQQ